MLQREQIGLGRLALADIDDNRDEMVRFAVRQAIERHRQLHPNDRAVGAEIAFFHRVGADFIFQQLLQLFQVGIEIERIGNVLEGAIHQFALGIVQHFADARVHPQPIPLQRNQRHPYRRLGEGLFEQGLRALQVGLQVFGIDVALNTLQILLHHGGEIMQIGQLFRGKRLRVAVDNAQGAERQPVERQQRLPDVETDPRPADHQRIIEKSRVVGGIGHHQRFALQDRMAAKRDIARRFPGIQTVAR